MRYPHCFEPFVCQGGDFHWSASAEGSWNVAVDAQGQKALQDAYLSGTTVSLKLYVDAAHYYSGEAFISSLSVEDPVDDSVNVFFEFQGTGVEITILALLGGLDDISLLKGLI